MFLPLLKFVTRGRTHAILVAGTIVALVPPLFFLSGALIAMVTLRYGPRDGAIVLGGAGAVIAALTLALFRSADPAFGFVAFMGGPVWILAVALGAGRSQGLMVTAGGALTALVYLVLHLVHGEPSAVWRGMLEGMTTARVADDPQAVAMLTDLLDKFEPALKGLPTGIMMCALLIVLLGRWWHSLLDNPGGFAREFRALRLDRRVAYVTVTVAVFAMAAGRMADGLGAELMQLVVSMYMLQGIAIVHAIAAARQLHAGWLVAMYLMLVFAGPLATLVLAVSGLSDTWVDYRRRFGGIFPGSPRGGGGPPTDRDED